MQIGVSNETDGLGKDLKKTRPQNKKVLVQNMVPYRDILLLAANMNINDDQQQLDGQSKQKV